MEKQNVGWKKNLSVEKKNVGWRIFPAKNGKVWTFPGMQDRKTAEAGKNPLGPIGEKKKLRIFFCQVVKKNVRWKKKCQRSKMTGLDLRPWTVIRNGNIRRCHAEGPGFESRRDQYLN